MFGRRTSRADRVRHDARSMAMRGLERGRHRAEALRDAMPEGGHLISDLRDQVSDLRDQAEPVLKAARDKAEKTPITPQKKSRSKKPFVLIALAVVGAVIAYVILSRRGHEPAYLSEEPDEPDTSPAEPPTYGATRNGWTSEGSPTGEPTTANGEGVPERASAYMAGQPAQPTQASSAAGATDDGSGTQPSTSSTSGDEASEQRSATSQSSGQQTSGVGQSSGMPSASPVSPSQSSTQSGSQPSSAPSFGYQPRAQVAAWDLPPSSIPPMRGPSL